ncbi:hypothetical protein SHKM778_49970 [Streptomyces sp. KM77-8]|uniref:Uncharacterized protein n=1 Tax=Streptomyces haneummycinicus TaxID=3074435 RepID=A0AAT9HMS8_9ACTN
MQVHSFRDGPAVPHLPEPPVCESDARQAAEQSGERGDEECLGGDRAADLAGVAPTARSSANSRVRWPTERATVPAAVKTATRVAMPPKEPPTAKRVSLA